MTALLRSLTQRFPDADGAELVLAGLRVAGFAVLLALLLLQGALGAAPERHALLTMGVAAGGGLAALGLLIWTARSPRVMPLRSLLMVGADIAVLAALLTLHDTLLAPLCLLMPVLVAESGLRRGRAIMAGAAILALSALAWLVWAAPYWREHAGWAASLAAGTIGVHAMVLHWLREREAVARERMLASQERTRFLASMSHELRTPIEGMLGMTDMLSSMRLTGEQRECAEVLRASASSLQALVEGVLDLRAAEAGKLTLNETDFRLQDLMRGVASMLGALAARTGVAFGTRVAQDVPDNLYGDVRRLRQVLAHLAHQAIKTARGRRVEIAVDLDRISTEAVYLRVSVRHGNGPATSGDVRTSESGIETTIARSLIALLGGNLAPLDPAQGTGHVALLPLRLATRAVAPVVLADTTHANVIAFDDPFLRHRLRIRPLRLLVADDQPANQLVLRKLLEKAGHTAVVVDGGEQVLDLLLAERFDAVLIDLHLPDISGIDVIKESRLIEIGGRRTPFIAISSDDSPDTVREVMRAGACVFVAKPVVATQLLDAIAEFTREEPVKRTNAAVRDSVVLDPTVLIDLKSLDLGRDFIESFIEQCMRDAGRALLDIERAAKASNWDAMWEACHGLRGVASNVGAVQLAAVCAEAARPTRTDLPREWRNYLRQLQVSLDRVRGQIPTVIAELRGSGSESDNDRGRH